MTFYSRNISHVYVCVSEHRQKQEKSTKERLKVSVCISVYHIPITGKFYSFNLIQALLIIHMLGEYMAKLLNRQSFCKYVYLKPTSDGHDLTGLVSVLLVDK